MRKTEDEYEAKTPFQVTTLFSRQELDDAQGAFLTLHETGGENLRRIVSWYVAKGLVACHQHG